MNALKGAEPTNGEDVLTLCSIAFATSAPFVIASTQNTRYNPIALYHVTQLRHLAVKQEQEQAARGSFVFRTLNSSAIVVHFDFRGLEESFAVWWRIEFVACCLRLDVPPLEFLAADSLDLVAPSSAQVE